MEHQKSFLTSNSSLLTSTPSPHTSHFLRFTLLPANVIVISLCLFSLITGIPSDSWTLGNSRGFAGFFGHQNLLASMLLFTIPGVFIRIKETSRKDKEQRAKSREQRAERGEVISDQKSVISKKYKVNYLQLTAYCLLLAANLLFLALTYSRAAMLSLAIGVIIYLILTKSWKIILYGFLVILASGIITFSIPSLKTEAVELIYKDFPSFLYTRQWLWEPSYEAALNGGLTGLGYGISDPSIILGEGTGSHYEGKVYEREKGNSVLALVEETGLIGLILFFLPVIYLLVKLKIKNEELKIDSENYSLLILTSALAAMLLHSQFEAWMAGVGSVQLPLFFVYLGLMVQSSKFDVS